MSEALYLYDLLGNTEAQEVILQKPYGMFVLENGGEFILSEQKIEEAKQWRGNGNIRRDKTGE